MEAGACGSAGADRAAGGQQRGLAGGLGGLMSTQTQEAAKLDQLAHAAPDEIEVAAGRERENLEGWVPAMASDAEVREALEKAFDYRGDITITRKDGSAVQGYVFDRSNAATLADSYVRVIPA